MPFDPDKFLAETGGFDPDKFLAETALTTTPPGAAAPSRQGTMETEAPPKEGFLERVGGYWTKDIPEAVGGAAERTLERAQRIEKPTVLGQKAIEATGAQGPVAGAVEAVAGTPERAGRLIGGAAGTMAEIPSLAVTLGADAFQNITGINLGDVVKPIADKIIGTQPVQKALEWWEGLTEAEKANYSSAIDISELAGYGAAAKVAPKSLEEVGQQITAIGKKQAAKKVETAIKKGIEKGVQPRYTSEKKTLSGMIKYRSNAKKAVSAINEYKEELNIIDKTGKNIKLPRNNTQFAEAIDQTKEKIFKKYNDLAIAAGDAGAQFNPDNIITKLDDVANDIGFTKDVRDYATSLKDDIEVLRGAAPETVQKRIKQYNKSLESFYADRSTRAKAEVDASIASAMREELDNNISNAVGGQYQELKKQYGALKAIEKDVNHRALQLAKKANKSMMDMTDIFTGGELVAGIATMNPALILRGATGRAAKEYMKWLNNPDRYIGNMFKTVEKYSPK